MDLDNGYDAFTTDNSLHSQADRPGQDAQQTRGFSARVHGPVGAYRLSSTTAYAVSDSVYSFDGDWGNDADWGEYAPYDYFSRYDRERTSLSEDLRVEGKVDERSRLGGRVVPAAARGGLAAA